MTEDNPNGRRTLRVRFNSRAEIIEYAADGMCRGCVSGEDDAEDVVSASTDTRWTNPSGWLSATKWIICVIAIISTLLYKWWTTVITHT